MRKTLFAGACPLILASLAMAADIAPAVEKAERDLVSAVTRADAAALEKLLAADLVYTHSSGSRDTRQSYLDKIRQGTMKYEKWDLEKVDVQRVTGDVAIVAARAAVRVISGGKPVEMKLSTLHVFARRQGRWQLVAHQSARLP